MVQWNTDRCFTRQNKKEKTEFPNDNESIFVVETESVR